jgi:CrcB protein
VSGATNRWWAIAAGGAIGTAARAGLLWAWPTRADAFPATVFAENVAGAFALGLLLGWLGRKERPGWWASPFFTVGALGSFTTFSTLVLDVAVLGPARPWLAIGYALASMLGGVVAAAAGWAMGHRAGRSP